MAVEVDDDRVRALVETYAAQQATLSQILLRVLLNLWSPFSWWDRPEMVRAWTARSTVEVDLALARVRRLSRSYASQMLDAADALEDLPEMDESYERGGTPISTVYERPARLFRHLQKEAERRGQNVAELADVLAGIDVDALPETWSDDDEGFGIDDEFDLDAIYDDLVVDDDVDQDVVDDAPPVHPADEFIQRLEEIIGHDVAATARDEEQKVYASSAKVTGYRRVIHPELSKTGSCGLCVAAANNFYTVAELLPIHDRCKCTTAPITAESDPALKLTREDLDALYAAAGGTTSGDALKRIRVTVNEHGEYGPILRNAQHRFKGVEDVNRERGTDFTPFGRQTPERTKAMWVGMKAQSEASLKALRTARRDAKETVTLGAREVPVADIDKAISYHMALISRAASHGA